MGSQSSGESKYSPPFHDYFQMMFEGADAMSVFWQPMLKGFGRQQLELANLSARQGQAFLQYMRNVSTSPSPAGLIAANTQYWQSITNDYAQSSRKLASVATAAAQQTATSELLRLPVRQNRDVMQLPLPYSHEEDVRKVA